MHYPIPTFPWNFCRGQFLPIVFYIYRWRINHYRNKMKAKRFIIPLLLWVIRVTLDVSRTDKFFLYLVLWYMKFFSFSYSAIFKLSFSSSFFQEYSGVKMTMTKLYDWYVSGLCVWKCEAKFVVNIVIYGRLL